MKKLPYGFVDPNLCFMDSCQTETPIGLHGNILQISSFRKHLHGYV